MTEISCSISVSTHTDDSDVSGCGRNGNENISRSFLLTWLTISSHIDCVWMSLVVELYFFLHSGKTFTGTLIPKLHRLVNGIKQLLYLQYYVNHARFEGQWPFSSFRLFRTPPIVFSTLKNIETYYLFLSLAKDFKIFFLWAPL